MHMSSYENMMTCFRRYVLGTSLGKQTRLRVLDVGGTDVNGGYRTIFKGPGVTYLVADIEDHPSVDYVLNDPYALPFHDETFDVVVSGQMLEHCEEFWRSFAEMMRVTKRGGFVFLIAPSGGPIHQYPVDCYRFYPDAYRNLARMTNSNLVDCWLDERGPWRDLVGVFSREHSEARAAEDEPTHVLKWSGDAGSPEEEVVGGRLPYLSLLDRLHKELQPRSYLEVGVRHGASLALAAGVAVGVDPAPEISNELPAQTRLLKMTSDAFFERSRELAIEPPDLVFIDGMHLFENVLRDFMHAERMASPGAVVLIDDIFPNHPSQALRERRTRVWTGDVWKLHECLKVWRPDLFLLPIDTSPTGMLLVAGLDPNNRTLWDNYNPIARNAWSEAAPPAEVVQRQGSVSPDGPELDRVLEVLENIRSVPRPVAEAVQQLRDAVSPPEPGPLRVSAGAAGIPLSVVVVGYNMARELPRTIRSLSPAMQRGIAAEDYEIILIDNGSTHPAVEDDLRRWAPAIRIVRMENASRSPVHAVNHGLSLAKGRIVGVCVDGARMATPGLLASAMEATRLHAKPVVGAFSFHLGPDLQVWSIRKGYNQDVEDELLASSGWEADGYRLFDISVFAGSAPLGWFRLPSESNAMFLTAEHWRSLGAFDERFQASGGGLVNLDVWLRACEDPGAQVVMLLGEGTFHQVHGGAATAAEDPHARWNSFHEEYIAIRQERWRMPNVSPIFFGRLPPNIQPSLKHSAEKFA